MGDENFYNNEKKVIISDWERLFSYNLISVNLPGFNTKKDFFYKGINGSRSFYMVNKHMGDCSVAYEVDRNSKLVGILINEADKKESQESIPVEAYFS